VVLHHKVDEGGHVLDVGQLVLRQAAQRGDALLLAAQVELVDDAVVKVLDGQAGQLLHQPQDLIAHQRPHLRRAPGQGQG
jgi:hypothetical protein